MSDADETPRPSCTGLTANYCPNHGHCTCPDLNKAMDGACPLHQPGGSHPYSGGYDGPTVGDLLRNAPELTEESARAIEAMYREVFARLAGGAS